LARTKTNTQNNTKTRRTLRHNRQLEKNTMFCVYRIFLFYLSFLQWFIQAILSYRHGTVNDFHCGLKPDIANLTLTQHLWEKEIKEISPYPGHQNMNKRTEKWKRKVHFKQVEGKKRTINRHVFSLYFNALFVLLLLI